MRLIDADALHKMLEEAQDGTRRIYSSLVDYGDKDVCKGELGTYARVKRMVEEAPTIDPESLSPKGRWIIKKRYTASKNPYLDDSYHASAICSECGFCVCADTGRFGYPKLNTTNYCPNCGAKMEG